MITDCKKKDQTEYRIEKVISRKCEELYVKWNGYANSFNSWVHEKDIT